MEIRRWQGMSRMKWEKRIRMLWKPNINKIQEYLTWVQSTLCNLKHCFVDCQNMYVVVWGSVGGFTIYCCPLETPGIRFHSNWTAPIPFDSQHSLCTRREFKYALGTGWWGWSGELLLAEWMEKASTPSFSPHSHDFHGKFIYPLLGEISRRLFGCLSRRAPWTDDNSKAGIKEGTEKLNKELLSLRLLLAFMPLKDVDELVW